MPLVDEFTRRHTVGMLEAGMTVSRLSQGKVIVTERRLEDGRSVTNRTALIDGKRKWSTPKNLCNFVLQAKRNRFTAIRGHAHVFASSVRTKRLS